MSKRGGYVDNDSDCERHVNFHLDVGGQHDCLAVPGPQRLPHGSEQVLVGGVSTTAEGFNQSITARARPSNPGL